MKREIVTDTNFLRQKSKAATAEDVPVAQDLLDTLRENQDRYSGLSANMIGDRKRIIAICNGPFLVAMMNPKIVSKSGKYIAEEECPVLETAYPVTRYKTITVSWQDMQMKERMTILDGYQAQTVQHLIDHLDGKLV